MIMLEYSKNFDGEIGSLHTAALKEQMQPFINFLSRINHKYENMLCCLIFLNSHIDVNVFNLFVTMADSIKHWHCYLDFAYCRQYLCETRSLHFWDLWAARTFWSHKSTQLEKLWMTYFCWLTENLWEILRKIVTSNSNTELL